MTLKEKILEVADNLEKEAFNYPKMRTMDVVNTVLRQLANSSYYEQTADDYAIEFAKWINDNCWNIEADRFLYEEEQYRYKELLEIFKKEKGL